MLGFTGSQRSLALVLSHVARPKWAIDCEPWEWNEGQWTRLFTVQEWQVGAVTVAVSGEQTHTGKVAHWVYVGGEDQFSGADRGRLASALGAAGRLLDSLAQYE